MSTQGVIIRPTGFGMVEWGLTISESYNNKDILDRYYSDFYSVEKLFEKLSRQDIDVLRESLDRTDFFHEHSSSGYVKNYPAQDIINRFSDWREYKIQRPVMGIGPSSVEWASVWDGMIWHHFNIKQNCSYDYEQFFKLLRTF